MSKQLTKVYEPDSRRHINFFKIWIIMFRNVITSRELIYQLFKRDFFMAYKKSFIGTAWILFSPIAGIISWVLMNRTGILNPGDVGIPYPAYVLLSTSIWGLFMGFYEAGASTLGAGSGFIMQVKYPHEALLVKQVAQHLANFCLGFGMNILVLIIFGVIPSWKLIFFPILVLPLFLLGAGIGLLISVISIVAIDLTKGIGMAFGLLLYVTPVIYSANTQSHLLNEIIKYNPLTYLIGATRDIIIYGQFNNIDRFLYSSLFALVVFMFSWRMFFISEEKVVERMI